MKKENKNTNFNTVKSLTTLAGLVTFLLISVSNVQAVNINPKGIGEVLIYPYYTVNNEFNTVYSVVNTTNQAKSIKVRFLEGDNNYEVLLFNVYLAPYDVWIGTLTPTTSSISGHVGQPSVLHTTNDNSCAPFLNKPGQQFLPFALYNDPLAVSAENIGLERSTEGHIEIMEVGVVTGSSATALTHDLNGVPNNCAQLEAAWSSNQSYWSIDPEQDMEPASGGLTGSASLLNINEGLAVSYNPIALKNFWNPGDILHTSPGSLLPTLGSSNNKSEILANKTLFESEWETGAEAITAALIQNSLYNSYNLQAELSAQTEWVVSFPTKVFHTNIFSSNPIPPFTSSWDGEEACESTSINIWDDAQLNNPPTALDLCLAVNVIEFLKPGQSQGAVSGLLGSTNLTTVNSVDSPQATDGGMMQLQLDANNQMMVDSNHNTYSGLPALGFMVNKYTNAAAPLGVLAQYSGLFMHTSERKIEADLIFKDVFE